MKPWMEHAACLDLPVELFFPQRGDMAVVTAALATCRRCPVRQDCLEHALGLPWPATGSLPGIWGGLSERGRRRVRRERGRGQEVA